MSRSKIVALAALITFGFGMSVIDSAFAGEKTKGRVVDYLVKVESIEVGDDEGHTISVYEAHGVGSALLGETLGEGVLRREVGFWDVNPTTGVTSGHGYAETIDKDGDKVYSTWEGKPVEEGSWEGTWSYTKGMGKYDGIKGGGTWKSYSLGPKQWYVDWEGEQELPAVEE